MTPLKKEGKASKPRQVHLSQKDVCCVETPEGQACGLMLVLRCLQNRTWHSDKHGHSHGYRRNRTRYVPLLEAFDEDIQSPPAADETIVMVNGTIIGFTRRPHRWKRLSCTCVATMISRRKCDLSGIVRLLKRYFHINTDWQPCDPCSVWTNLRKYPKFSATKRFRCLIWSKLENGGAVEYLDREEERRQDALKPGCPC